MNRVHEILSKWRNVGNPYEEIIRKRIKIRKVFNLPEEEIAQTLALLVRRNFSNLRHIAFNSKLRRRMVKWNPFQTTGLLWNSEMQSYTFTKSHQMCLVLAPIHLILSRSPILNLLVHKKWKSIVSDSGFGMDIRNEWTLIQLVKWRWRPSVCFSLSVNETVE